MKKLDKIFKIYKNKEIQNLSIEQEEMWLRSKIVIQFIYLREKKGLSQKDIAEKMGVSRQQITKFENLTNSPTIFFLVKYATALDTKLDVILKGVSLVEMPNNE